MFPLLRSLFGFGLIAMLATACVSQQREVAPREITGELKATIKTLSGPFGLDTSKLPELTEREFLKIAAEPNTEIYRIPANPRFADSFSYRIFYRPWSHQFWIERWGGFAGHTKYFGPIKIKS